MSVIVMSWMETVIGILSFPDDSAMEDMTTELADLETDGALWDF